MPGAFADFTCTIDGGAWEVLRCEAQFARLADCVRHNLEAALCSGRIADRGVLKDTHATLLLLDVLQGRMEDAVNNMGLVRSYSDKASAKLTACIITEAIIRARSKPGEGEFGERVCVHFAHILRRLPLDVVRDELKQMRAYLELKTPAMYEGIVRANVEPIVAARGSVDQEIARMLVQIRYNLVELLPICEALSGVLDGVIGASEIGEVDIWRSRTVDLPGRHDRSSVVIGIWDSGVDPAVFPSAMADVGGKSCIAWDIDVNPSSEALHPRGRDRVESHVAIMEHLRGFQDLRLGKGGAHVEALKRRLSTLSPADATPFLEDVALATDYIHGTHVAGIALDGNPRGRILSARVTWDYRLSTFVPGSRRRVEAQIAAYRETIDFFRRGRARIVNISWNRAPSLYIGGSGWTSASTEMFEMDRSGLRAIMEEAQDVLFVGASGNSAANVDAECLFPASFRLSNLIVVGAADKAGHEATFSNFGESVAVYGPGCDIESFIPGGARMTFSGTSMAAAQITNLAAKILSIEPLLAPPDVIALIVDNSDPSPDGRYRLVNPRRSVEVLIGAKEA
jgi:hypothetical protein